MCECKNHYREEALAASKGDNFADIEERPHASSKQTLPPTNIVPLPELVADFTVNPYRAETHHFMQADARIVRQCDASECSVVTSHQRTLE